MFRINQSKRLIEGNNLMKRFCFKLIFCFIAGMFFFSSCYSERDLKQRYDKGYSEGRANGYSDGRNSGYSDGYYTAKTEYEKQISELRSKINTMEKNHSNSITTMEINHKNSITTMQNNHRRELTSEYNRGFQKGEDSMMNKILTRIDFDTQQKIVRNRRNEPLFSIK